MVYVQYSYAYLLEIYSYTYVDCKYEIYLKPVKKSIKYKKSLMNS